jgi:hypothetical protein
VDFEKKLQAAIQRGQVRGDAAEQASQQARLSQEELRRRHNSLRLALSDHVEQVLKQTAEHFPGFTYETLYGDRGWGGAIRRDDLMRGGAMFSRLEITVRPLGEFPVVSLAGKGTVRNRELFPWQHHAELEDARPDALMAVIDSWVLGYAEQFAAR